MEGKENAPQEQPNMARFNVDSFVKKECIFYPPPNRVKSNIVLKIRDEDKSKREKCPLLIDRQNIVSPKFGLKRSKPLEPSQRPKSVVKRSTHDQLYNTPIHKKRSTSELETDGLDEKCILKPKKLKFSEDFNTSYDSIDVNQDNTGLSLTLDEDTDQFQIESDRGYDEMPTFDSIGSQTPCSALHINENYGLDTPETGYDSKYEEDMFALQEIRIQDKPCSSNWNSNGKENIADVRKLNALQLRNQKDERSSLTHKKDYKRKFEDMIFPPFPRKRRCLPGIKRRDISSAVKDEVTSDIDPHESVNAPAEEMKCEKDQFNDCFSSPLISGPRKRLFNIESQSTPKISLESPANLIRSYSKGKSNKQLTRERHLEMSSPISSAGDNKVLQGHRSTPKHRKMIMEPPATSTPRRPSCARLQVFSQGNIGPNGDGGLNISSHTTYGADVDGQEQFSEGHSYNGSETGIEQNLFSQGPSSSQIQSVVPSSEGEHERSTVYYPESSSEPDRFAFGEIPYFHGLDSNYQFTSMYQGIDIVNRVNVLGGQSRYTLLGHNYGTPTARRHLNFEPMVDAHIDDQNVPLSLMDPEE